MSVSHADPHGFPTPDELVAYVLDEVGPRELRRLVDAAISDRTPRLVSPEPKLNSAQQRDAEDERLRGTVARLERVVGELTTRLQRLERLATGGDAGHVDTIAHYESRVITFILGAPSKRVKEKSLLTVCTASEMNELFDLGTIRRVKGGWIRCAANIEGKANARTEAAQGR